jgi:pilus assembly protein CpaB
MLLRLALFGFLTIGVLGFGGFAWITLHAPVRTDAASAGAPPVVATLAVLAAAQPLRPGSLLKPADIGVADLPPDRVPEGARNDTAATRSELVGAMVRRSLGAGEPLLPEDVLRPGEHGFLAAVLGADMRAVSVGVDAVSGAAGLIWPGDRVDLILTQAINDPALPLGRRVAGETVLSDVRVIAIDQHLLQGAVDTPGPENLRAGGRTVTLEVSARQAERVAVAARLGMLALSVRAVAQPGIAVQAADGAVTWASDVSPALRPGGHAGGATVRVYMGNGKSEEFRY